MSSPTLPAIRLMMEELSRAPYFYRPGPYWEPHSRKLAEDLIAGGGIPDDFRQTRTKAYGAFGGTDFTPNREYRPRLWKVHEAMLRIPVLRQLASAYEDQIRIGFARAKSEHATKLRLLVERLESIAPHLAQLDDRCIGSPQTVTVEGRRYTAEFVRALTITAEIESKMPLRDVRVTCEIGGGFGALAEVMLRTQPERKVVVVDIPPVCAYAEHYLERLFPGEVLGFERARTLDAIDPMQHEERTFVLASYQIEKLKGPFDLFMNVASFQEMPADIVRHYAETILAAGTKKVYLRNRRTDRSSPGVDTELYKTVFGNLRLAHEWRDVYSDDYVQLLFETIT